MKNPEEEKEGYSGEVTKIRVGVGAAYVTALVLKSYKVHRLQMTNR